MPSVSSAAASTHAPPLNRKLSRGCSYLNAQVCRVQSQIRFQLKLESNISIPSLTSPEENLRRRMARDARTCSSDYAHTLIRAHGVSTSPHGRSLSFSDLFPLFPPPPDLSGEVTHFASKQRRYALGNSIFETCADASRAKLI